MSESVRDRPEFLAGASLAGDAYEFALRAHEGQRRKGDDSPYIVHPVEVARLVQAECGGDEEQLAATLLHDVVEDTETALDEIRDRFGIGVGELVEALSEDESIEPFEARKDHHRGEVAAAGHRAIAIYAADKLANLRDMRTLYAAVGEAAEGRFNAPIDVRVRLWRRDVEMIERLAPDLPLLPPLRSELEAFEAERQTTT